MKKMLLALSLAIAANAFAIETNCDKYKESYGRTYCLSKLFVESDNELNDVYQELRGKISKEAQKSLKDTEIRWIKYRTSKCEVSPGTIDVRCSYEVNRDRTNYLRDRLRECNSRMCDNAAIGRQSW